MTNPIATARFKLTYDRPYLAPLVWSLIPVETPGLGTLAVDQYHRLYYDPDIGQKWSMSELVSVLYHEILHLLRSHPERGEGKNQTLFNIAGDAEINDDIIAERCWNLPGQAVTPSSIGEEDGKLAEVYYEALKKKAKKFSPSAKPSPGQGKCGSAATGSREDWEQGPPTKNRPGLKKGQSDLVKQKTAKEIEAHASKGTVPGHLERWAKEFTRGKIDWRKTLATMIRHAVQHASGASDFTFKKISRRGSGDIILPSPYQPQPSIAIVADTSGSISNKQLAQALAEIDKILKTQNTIQGVHVLAVDATVQTANKIFRKNQLKLTGGGGTDMRVGIQAANELRPDIIIVLTDGHTPWPQHPPRSKTIVCLLPSPYSPSSPPKWAKVVKVED